MTFTRVSTGSAWPLKAGSQTVLVSNEHVVEDCVRFHGGQTGIQYGEGDDDFAIGEVRSTDYPNDQEAIITIDFDIIDALPTAGPPKKGHWVMAVGNPSASGIDTVTFGQVSNYSDFEIAALTPQLILVLEDRSSMLRVAWLVSTLPRAQILVLTTWDAGR